MEKIQNVIAVDGPSGSGKSTVAKAISVKLNLIYIDTGSMFRAVGLILKRMGIPLEEEILGEDDLKKIDDFFMTHHLEYAPNPKVLIRIDGEDLTEAIRDHHVSYLASLVSKNSLVRKYLADWQRKIVSNSPAILDGRDIGTVIFPQARLKVFLTASADERAKRRFEELKAKNQSISYEQILSDIKSRDHEDTQRLIAPLKKADDAIEINSTQIPIEEIVKVICDEWRKRC